MRTPPRAKRCQSIIDELEDLLKYFLPSSEELDRLRIDIRYLREYINEISEEKKLTEIKLAAKIKKDLSDGATTSEEDSSEDDS